MLYDKKIILGSQSPRRKELIERLGLNYEVQVSEVNEIYPKDLPYDEIALYLAKLKAKENTYQLKENEILLTADTIVALNGKILGKPKSEKEAKTMLEKLSGNSHEVITSVYLKSLNSEKSITNRTIVRFSPLEDDDINHYIENYKPFDKAGAYGIQEWMGYIAINKIEGCFYSVMGLPVHDVYQALKEMK